MTSEPTGWQRAAVVPFRNVARQPSRATANETAGRRSRGPCPRRDARTNRRSAALRWPGDSPGAR